MVEKYGFYVLAASAALGAIGYFWLWIRAFRERVLWGLALLLPPLAILFIWRHFGKARGPALVLGLACMGVAVPYGAAYYERHFVPLQPYEQMVDGELRLTLTGLKDFDYSTLQGKRAIAVLQMANPDVDDQTLRHLQDQNKLRLLDLSDTAITDAGLAKVAELPALRELHLARTKITDEGFRQHLMPKATLLKVNLTGTEVKGKTKREWKRINAEQREYVD